MHAMKHLTRLIIPLLFVTLATGLSIADSNIDTPRNVLLLLSYKHKMPWQRLVAEHILSAIETNEEISIDTYIEYTGLNESGDPSRVDTLQNYYRNIYSPIKVDLVISIGLPSSSFVLEKGRELFGKAPVLFISAVHGGLSLQELPSNATGIFESIDIKGSIDVALRMLPDTRRITVVSGSSEIDRLYMQRAETVLDQYGPDIMIDRMTGLSVSALGRRASRLPDNTIIFYVTTLKDNEKRTLIPGEVVAHLASVANAPIFVLWESLLGSGAVGGKLSSTSVAGEKAGDMALEILRGKAPDDIPVVVGTNAYMFDWRQLQRWQIRKEHLPGGSILRYKSPSFFELYGTYIIATVVLIAIQTLLIAALLFNRAKYLKAQQALAKSHEMLEFQVEKRTKKLKDEIQERKRAERQLKESESFLTTILDAIQDGIVVLDPDLNIILANQTMKSIYADEGPLVGKKCHEVYFGRDERCEICPSVRVLETGKMAMDEVPFSKFGSKDGTAELFAFPVFDSAGRINSVVEYIRDITERARSRELLAERELIYRSLFDKNISVMLLIDPDSGTIIDANPSACEYYGFTKADLTKMNISEINTLSTDQISLEMQQAKSENRSQFNFRHRLSNGDIRDVEVFSGPISISGRTVLCSIVHDISRRKAAEKDREKIIGQLQKALSEVKTLQGFLPICASCKKIRDDKGYWNQIEFYIQTHSDAQFSHGLCPECARKLYPEYDG